MEPPILISPNIPIIMAPDKKIYWINRAADKVVQSMRGGVDQLSDAKQMLIHSGQMDEQMDKFFWRIEESYRVFLGFLEMVARDGKGYTPVKVEVKPEETPKVETSQTPQP